MEQSLEDVVSTSGEPGTEENLSLVDIARLYAEPIAVVHTRPISPDESVLRCVLCKHSFSNKKQYRHHLRGGKNGCPVLCHCCTVCHRVFNSDAQLKDHELGRAHQNALLK